MVLDDETFPIIKFITPEAFIAAPVEQQFQDLAITEIQAPQLQRSSINTSNRAISSIDPNSELTARLNDESTAEHTFAMLKPDVMTPSIIDDVMSTLYHNRGPILAMELSKVNGIEAWRQIVGPRDPKDARLDKPKSLRGMYGKDSLMNSFHASDGPISADREIALIFSNVDQKSYLTMPYIAPTNSRSLQSSGIPQKSLAVIKPNAMLKIDQIIDKIVARGFQITKREEVLLTVERAQELSLEFLETPQFEESVQVLMSAPVLCLSLKGENAIENWLEMLGPSDPEVARAIFPQSMRAQFGIDAVNNGLHGSLNVEIAIQQLHSFFPHYLNKTSSIGSIFKSPIGSRRASQAGSRQNLANESLRASVSVLEEQRREMKAAADVVSRQAAEAIAAEAAYTTVERSLALIKPDTYPGKKDEIMAMILADGFEVIAEKEESFTREKAELFYKEHEGKNFYVELTEWISSAPIYALILERVNGIKKWRNLAGPANSNKARAEFPNSVRGLFGTYGLKNAVHGSDSSESATREIEIVFGPEFSSVPELQNTLALIKPDAYPEHKDKIILMVKDANFAIIKQSESMLSKEKAKEIFDRHAGDEFYEEFLTWICSSSIYVMILEKRGAIKEWIALAGPIK
ncbi:Thioredoxin domain-containing protein 3 [Physocladia obscura]|uniref:Nucleoside diphosphate kinase n=1 Tax=Physocladia obscura TaxID=109957 RepID=A0AAD5T666_9FUNG|nr:Thioredoxin domain-containing protein 3 [Physocladia obscura]